MKPKLLLFSLVILSALFLGACSGSSRLTASSWPGVIATEEHVYLAFGPQIYALDAKNGNETWKFPPEVDNKISFYGAPAISPDGTELIAGAYNNTLYSINLENGQSGGWTFAGATNRYIGNILATEDGIFAPNASGYLFALDFQGSPIWAEPYNTGEPQWSAPATDGQTLYIAALDHQIHAVDIETGQMRWSLDLETASTGTPAIAEGVLYAGTFGNKVFAIDTDTGEVIWSFETQDWVWASPTVSGNVVIAGDISGNLYAINIENGREIWHFEAEGGIFGTPLVVDDMIYFGTENGKFYALTLESDISWFFNFTGKIYSQPAYNGEYIFVATIQGDVTLTALDLNGTARWPFSPTSEE